MKWEKKVRGSKGGERKRGMGKEEGREGDPVCIFKFSLE